MAGSTVRRDLYLQVNASTDQFSRAMKSAAAELVDFDGDVEKMLASVQANFDQLGANDNPARALTTSFKSAFAEIQAQAKDVLKGAPTQAGAIGLDVASAQRGAVAATQQAVALREIADAAARAAIATNGENDALRVYAVSAAAAASAAEMNAKGLRDQAAVLQDVQTELNAAGATSARTGDVVVAAHGRMSASGMILQHVMRSTVDSFNAGLPITMILGEQMARLSEAAALSAAEAGENATAFQKFGAIMGGNVGLAITALLAVLGPLVAKLFEAHDALQLAKIGNDGLSDAQSVLGRMFDLTSGKLEHQNDLLKLNAQLTAVNLRAEASKEKADSDKTLGGAGRASWGAMFSLGAAASGDGDTSGILDAMAKESSKPSVTALVKAIQAGTIDPSSALKQADRLDYSGLAITKQQLEQAIVDRTAADFKGKTADEIEKSLADGKLAPELRRDTKPKKPKVDHSAEQGANKDRAYEGQLTSANDALVKARLQLAHTAQDEYDVRVAQLRADLSTRNQAVQDEVTAKKLTQAQADTLKAKNTETEKVQEQVAQRQLQIALYDQAYDLDKQDRDNRIALLQIDETFATTRQQRLDLEKRLLAEQQAQTAADLNRTIATSNDTSPGGAIDRAKQELAAQPAINAAQNKQADHNNQDPLDAYKEQLTKAVGTTDAMKDSLKSVAVDGLKGIEDGFAGIISGTETVAQAFKSMAASIISDLAKIAIEKALVSVLGLSTGGPVEGNTVSVIGKRGGGLIPGFATGGLNGLFSGIGGPTDDKNLVAISNGEFITNAEATRQNLPLLKAINDNRLPRFATGGMLGSAISAPRLDVANLSPVRAPAGGVRDIHIDLRGAVTTEELVGSLQEQMAQFAQGAVKVSNDHTDDMLRLMTRAAL